VRDLEAMAEFYKGLLGFEEEFRHAGRMVSLRTGGAELVLNAAEESSRHVGLSFTCRDIRGIRDRLLERGVPITTPLQKGHWGQMLLGFEDPEGNRVYMEQRRPARGRGGGHHH